MDGSVRNVLDMRSSLALPGQVTPVGEEMKERVRKRISIAEKSMCKGGRVRNMDIGQIEWHINETKVREWQTDSRKKRVGKLLALLVTLQLVLVATQCAGVLGDDAFLLDGSTRTPSYHALVGAISLVVLGQVFFVHRYHMMELEMLPMTNPLWGETPMWDSPILMQYVIEMLLFALHEPPCLALAWHNAYKLGILCVLKSFIFWRVFADMSYTQQQGGKLVSAIARIRITWTYQLRAAAYSHPWVFQIAVSVTWLLVLSACTVVANDERIGIGDAVWGTFAIMTSGDPRITEPDNWMAKLIAACATIVGLVLVSLLISQISRSMELTVKQKRVLLFMAQAQRHQKIEELAAQILCRGFINVRLVKEGQSPRMVQKARSALSALCEEFRNVRRGFNNSVADFHALWPDNLPVATKLREIDTMLVHIFDDKYGASRRAALVRALSKQNMADGPFQSRRETTRFIRKTKSFASQPDGDETGSSSSSPVPVCEGDDEVACTHMPRTPREQLPHPDTGKILGMLESVLASQRELQAQCATLSRDVQLLKLGMHAPPSPPTHPPSPPFPDVRLGVEKPHQALPPLS